MTLTEPFVLIVPCLPSRVKTSKQSGEIFPMTTDRDEEKSFLISTANDQRQLSTVDAIAVAAPSSVVPRN